MSSTSVKGGLRWCRGPITTAAGAVGFRRIGSLTANLAAKFLHNVAAIGNHINSGIGRPPSTTIGVGRP